MTGRSPRERILARCLPEPHPRFGRPCLIFSGAKNTRGYGQIRIGGRSGKLRLTHIVIYEAEYGPVPDGLEVDHGCSRKPCCEITHLEAVTGAVNVRRALGTDGDVCRHGHPWLENERQDKRGRRYCRECNRLRVLKNSRVRRSQGLR